MRLVPGHKSYCFDRAKKYLPESGLRLHGIQFRLVCHRMHNEDFFPYGHWSLVLVLGIAIANIPNRIEDGTVPFPEDAQKVKHGISLEFKCVRAQMQGYMD